MGTFVLEPLGIGLSDITMSLEASTTNNYRVDPNSIDLNYGERQKAAHNARGLTGAQSTISNDPVDIKFTVYVFGTTQANALANLRTLTQAVIDKAGGYLKYKPTGLADGVMDTYYRYLVSSPPALPRGDANQMEYYAAKFSRGASGQEYAIIADVTLTTLAWGTSDPDSLVTIVNAADIENNYSGGTHNHYVTISSASIKGDLLFPVVEITGGLSGIIVFSYPYTGSLGDEEWWIPAGTDEGDGWYIDGMLVEVLRNEDISTSGETKLLTLNPSYTDGIVYQLGKVTPILIAECNDEGAEGSEFDAKIQFVSANDTDVVFQETGTIRLSGDINAVYYDFGELDLPPFDIPEYITQDSTPSLKRHISNSIYIGINLTALSSSANDIELVGLVLAKADEFIVYAHSDDALIGNDAGTVVLSSFADQVYVRDSVGYQEDTWSTLGSPLRQFHLDAGRNHRINFVMQGKYTGRPYLTTGASATVKGIYGTIMPFDES